MASIDEMKAEVLKIKIPYYMQKIIAPSLQKSGYYGSGEGYFAYTDVERCPFHNENTASFRYYCHTNTCYCFGCGIGGDLIAIHRKYIEDQTGREASFYETLKELYDWSQSEDIAEHQTVEQFVYQQTIEDWQAQNKVQLLIFRDKLQKAFTLCKNTEQYKILCELERFTNNEIFDISEISKILDKFI